MKRKREKRKEKKELVKSFLFLKKRKKERKRKRKRKEKKNSEYSYFPIPFHLLTFGFELSPPRSTRPKSSSFADTLTTGASAVTMTGRCATVMLFAITGSSKLYAHT